MTEEAIPIPPIRTALEDIESIALSGRTDNPPRTEKSWYLYWQKTGARLSGLITYGTHADRPSPGKMPDGAFYVETDRNMLYQNSNGAWHYLAGTMWGTFVPDERPTDLGVNDGGFWFRGTDQAREHMWTQTQWLDVTAARYGLHADRQPAAQVMDSQLYIETDRSNVIYQMQAGAWHYLAGTMYGTLAPDQRPVDLGVNDGGFEFRATDQQRHFIWSQTAWVEVTALAAAGNDVQVAYASAQMTLTTAAQTVPGTVLTLPRAGIYLIHGVFYFSCLPGDGTNYLLGSMPGSGSQAVVRTPVIASGQSLEVTVSQQWLFTALAANSTISLEASKTGGTGASYVGPTHTSISALWVSA